MNHGGTEVTERTKKMNREEIEAEVDSIASDRFENLHARPVVIAWLEYQNDLSIDQQCPYCAEDLAVTDHGETCTVSCPCGKSESVFHGL
jgi:hypothetical protein